MKMTMEMWRGSAEKPVPESSLRTRLRFVGYGIRERAAQGDGMDLIRRVTEYTKDSSCRVLFFDADQKILFEDELGAENGSISVKDVSYFPGSGGGSSGVCGSFAYYAG